ncbi:MAG: haloacid dehalogenase superfamily protein subfamily variant 3 with third motif having or [Planctomycetota bacterium]|nr:haloacid dehalogenase superfamily protein subfamily variant 3 with third motif having or [Planctomycetota bacterium]
MIRAVIFDFNGVLVDDESVHFDLFREVLAEEGVELTEAQYHEHYLGFDDRRCFEEVLTDRGRSPTPTHLEDLIARKAARYIPRAEQGLRYFPGADEAIRSLADRWPLAINSGALRPEIEYSLSRMGVRDRVMAIVSAEDATNGKPDPEGYLLALDALRSLVGDDLEAGHCLVFEDSLAGIQSAKGAGMWAVGVSNTYTDPLLRSAGADAVLPGLERLTPSWVEGMFAPEVSP